jgi:hypothetical protein
VSHSTRNDKPRGVLILPADLAPTAIKAALGPLVDTVSCFRCKEGIKQTVKSIVAAWVGIKVSLQIPRRSQVPNGCLSRPRYDVSNNPQSPLYTINHTGSNYTRLLAQCPWTLMCAKITLILFVTLHRHHHPRPSICICTFIPGLLKGTRTRVVPYIR